MSNPISVFVVVGTDASGRAAELAKFFTSADADAHLSQFLRPSHQGPWRDVTVIHREESLDDQHHTHGGKVGAPIEEPR